MRTFILSRLPGVPAWGGRWRFEQYVTRPVPAHVGKLTARFDLNMTLFDFEPPFDRGAELLGFEPAPGAGWKFHRILLGGHVGEPTGASHRVVPPMTTVWLYVNDRDGRGAIVGIP